MRKTRVPNEVAHAAERMVYGCPSEAEQDDQSRQRTHKPLLVRTRAPDFAVPQTLPGPIFEPLGGPQFSGKKDFMSAFPVIGLRHP
jgi:hypothetical protein